MVSNRLALGGAALACAACCAPLAVPLVWPALISVGVVGAGAEGTGWLAGMSLDAILCGGIALAAVAGGAVWFRQTCKRTTAAIPRLKEGAACDLEICGPSDRTRTYNGTA